MSVRDHINRTGENPLRGKWLGGENTNFIDLTNLYNFNKDSIITDCCGNKRINQYPFPSPFLCHISIIAKALAIDKISAYVVNIP
tara:strand:+ start:106 stop:360 length:255 start_codon:yes stop_codon:yes gene_type:complete